MKKLDNGDKVIIAGVILAIGIVLGAYIIADGAYIIADAILLSASDYVPPF